MKKKKAWIGAILCSLSAFSLFAFTETKIEQPHIISEVCERNYNAYRDADGNYPLAWIELANASEGSLALDGDCLKTDTGVVIDVLSKDDRPDAKQYRILTIDEAGANALKHASELYLERNGQLLDSIPLLHASKDISVGYYRQAVSFMQPSPGRMNAQSDVCGGELQWEPHFSMEAGFYETPVAVEISCDDPNVTVYYTTDGSVPNRRSKRYTGQITIDDASSRLNRWCARKDLSAQEYFIPLDPVEKCTILQAVAYDAQGRRSKVAAASYFIGKDLWQKYAAEHSMIDLPILSITADSKQLFDARNGALVLGKEYYRWLADGGAEEVRRMEEFGSGVWDYKISANFRMKNRESEVPVLLELFENGRLSFVKQVGMRNRGVTSSNGTQKCFNIYARDCYDDAPLLEDDILGCGRKVQRFALKPWDGILYDGLLTDLVSGDTLLPLHVRPVIVFLEGEYWGVYAMVEKYDAQYFEDCFGIAKEDLQVVKNGEDGAGTVGSAAAYAELIEWAKANDLRDAKNYHEFCDRVDIDSLIDWYCANIYMDNIDGFEYYNVLRWRSTNPDDGAENCKWHWALYDMDSSLRDVNRNNMTEDRSEEKPAYFHHELMQMLLQNEDFKASFRERFTQMMDNSFDVDAIAEKYASIERKLAVPISESVCRFSGDNYQPEDFVQREITDKLEFWKGRRAVIEKQLNEYIGRDQETDVE